LLPFQQFSLLAHEHCEARHGFPKRYKKLVNLLSFQSNRRNFLRCLQSYFWLRKGHKPAGKIIETATIAFGSSVVL